MPARSKARKRAVDILFACELGGTDPMRTLADWLARADPSVPEYAVELVKGVTEHRGKIDELLATHAEGWTLPRMPPVDRTVLRVGAYELLWCPDVPAAVAISEAVALAGSLSTADSAAFVNGLLARLHTLRQAGTAEPTGGLGVPAGVGEHDTPLDQLLDEPARAVVVDHGD